MQWVNFWNSQQNGHPLCAALLLLLGWEAGTWTWGCPGTDRTRKERNNQPLGPKWPKWLWCLDIFSSELNHHHQLGFPITDKSSSSSSSSMIIHDHLVQQTPMNRPLYLVEKDQFFWTQAPGGTGQGVIIIITIHIRWNNMMTIKKNVNEDRPLSPCETKWWWSKRVNDNCHRHHHKDSIWIM